MCIQLKRDRSKCRRTEITNEKSQRMKINGRKWDENKNWGLIFIQFELNKLSMVIKYVNAEIVSM